MWWGRDPAALSANFIFDFVLTRSSYGISHQGNAVIWFQRNSDMNHNKKVNMLNGTENGRLSSESRSGISGGRQSRKGKFVYNAAEVAGSFSQQAKSSLCQPLGEYLWVYQKWEKKDSYTGWTQGRTELSSPPPPRLGPLSPGVTVILLLLPEPTGPILDTGVLCPVTCHCPREPQQRPCGVGERISPPLGSQEGCLSFSIFWVTWSLFDDRSRKDINLV